ncbi:MAG: EamA family transporter, partial [Pseudonocardiaceae bacterium]|nr:EamA family transporter [Pseudonocardiaceae bacterium]
GATALTRPRLATRLTDVPVLAAIGVLIVGADTMYATATTLASLAVVAVLSALHPVVTMGLARIYLREQITRPQLVGIATCLSGVLAIAAS